MKYFNLKWKYNNNILEFLHFFLKFSKFSVATTHVRNESSGIHEDHGISAEPYNL